MLKNQNIKKFRVKNLKFCAKRIQNFVLKNTKFCVKKYKILC